jgi:hypothetical protein
MNELFTEFSTYDDSTIERKQIPVDHIEREGTEEELEPFHDVLDEVDEIFPWGFYDDGKLKSGVRADDLVKISVKTYVTRGCGCQTPAIEHFWVHVVAVTSSGIVIGIPLSNLHCVDVGPHTPIFFPVNCVIFSRKGKNWPAD